MGVWGKLGLGLDWGWEKWLVYWRSSLAFLQEKFISKTPGKCLGIRNSTWVQEKDLFKGLFLYLGLRGWIRRSSVYYRRTNLENMDLPSASLRTKPQNQHFITFSAPQNQATKQPTTQCLSSEMLWLSVPHLPYSILCKGRSCNARIY